jgi:hypothetical protein
MLKGTRPEANDVIAIARILSQSSDVQVVEIIRQLRGRKELSTTVRSLNHLLADPSHRDVALLAFRRMGLEHGG